MIFRIVSFSGPPLILAVAVVMIFRKLYREFPFFFVYLVTVLTAEIVRRFFQDPLSITFFYVYWLAEAVIVCVAFLALYEVFLVRVFPKFNTTPIYRYLFPVSGLIVLALTAIMFISTPSSGPSRLAIIVGEFTLALSFFQVAVLFFFFCLSLFMSREWGRHDLGIALGFGFYASIKLIITILRANHYYARTAFDQLPAVAYVITAVIWLFFFLRPDPEPPETVVTHEMVDHLNRARKDLRTWFRRN